MKENSPATLDADPSISNDNRVQSLLNDPLEITVVRCGEGGDLPLPSYQSSGAVGLDLRASIGERETITLRRGHWHSVPCGIRVAIPPGFEGQVRGRSGLARRFGIGLVNGVGTIDQDYRGEISVLLINHGRESFVIQHSERIAQLIISPVARVSWIERADLEETERAGSGFGSTGI